MRRKLNRQTNLFTAVTSNPIARELGEISKIIDANSGVLDLVYQDLVKAKRHDTGREGLTAEQVLRCCILKQYRQLSYEELASIWMTHRPFAHFPVWRWGNIPASRFSRRTSSPCRKRPGRRSIAGSSTTRKARRSKQGGRSGLIRLPLRRTFIIRRTRHCYVTASG